MTMHRKVTIAIDFDRTFTSDVEFWREFIQRAVARGHVVYCVTCREDCARNHTEVAELFGSDVFAILRGCVFTSHEPKRAICVALGIHIDIWIDDIPEYITATDGDAVMRIQATTNAHETLPLFN